jgi:protocatechuate 3,4-dioxygenase beta subunit
MNPLVFSLLLGALSVFSFQAVPPAPAQARNGSVEGTVVNAAGEAALKGVSVQLIPASGGTTIKADTDDKGAFSFKEVAPGRYRLAADRTGFIREEYGAHGVSASGTVITVLAGQAMKDLVFKLKPMAVIAGKVLNEEGEPVPNLAVTAFRPGYSRGRRELQLAGSAMTNDLGEFRVARLAPGCYLVAATALSGVPSATTPTGAPVGDAPEEAYVTTFFPHSADANSGTCVQVGMGAEARGYDIRMVRTKTVRLKGKLSGMPPGAEGGAIFLARKNSGVSASGGGFLITGGMAPANPPDFTFEFKGLRPGSYLLAGMAFGESRNTLSGSMTIELGNDRLENIVSLAVGPAEVLTGAVVAEDAEPGKVDMKGAQVAIEPLEPASRFRSNGAVASDGSFTLRDVAREQYRVRLTGGPETAYVKAVRLGADNARNAEIDLTGCAGGRTLQIVLSTAGAQVDGVVTSDGEKAMPGATVTLIPDSRRSELYKNTTTDQNGGFTFKGIAPGDYKLLAWDAIEPGLWEDPEFVRPFESKAEGVSLKEKERKAYSLRVVPAEQK